MTSNHDASYKILTADQDNGTKLRRKSSSELYSIRSGDGFKAALMPGSDKTYYATFLQPNPPVQRITLTGDSTMSVVDVITPANLIQTLTIFTKVTSSSSAEVSFSRVYRCNTQWFVGPQNLLLLLPCHLELRFYID